MAEPSSKPTTSSNSNDVSAKETAFVPPEDAGMIGNDEVLNEQIKTNEERAKTDEATPDTGLTALLMRYGGLFGGLLLGYWFGARQTGVSPFGLLGDIVVTGVV